jgi:RNA polymerase sigma-70 factor (ECF subfamily)
MSTTTVAPAGAVNLTTQALQRLADGRDGDAWSFIVERHGPRMFRSALNITGDGSLAEDACQEAFLYIRTAAGRFKPRGLDHESAATGWIMRVTVSSALQLMRSRRRRQHHERQARHVGTRSDTVDAAHGDVRAGADLDAALRHELADLPESYRVPLTLHYFSGLDYESIANEIGCSVGNARVRVHRAIERLRSRLMRVGGVMTAGALVTKLGAIESVPIASTAHLLPHWCGLIHSPATSVISTGTMLGGISIVTKVSLAVAGVAAVGLVSALAPGVANPGQKTGPIDARIENSAPLADNAASAREEGLASLYPGDENIGRDPRVLFVEDFETGTVADIVARWGHGGPRAKGGKNNRMDIASDCHAASPGKRSLTIGIVGDLESLPAADCGGQLYTHTRPVDQMYLRFYVKFHERHGYVSQFCSLVAERNPKRWPNGWDGKKPAGDALFASTLFPRGDTGKIPPPGAWSMSSYWQAMQPNGNGEYWGNRFRAGSDPIARGEWMCVEAMVKANSAPDVADGEQSFWVDGTLVGEFTGIHWRTTNALKLNAVWLLYDIRNDTARRNHDSDPQSRRYEVWFDDVVVATEYIGPVCGRPK